MEILKGLRFYSWQILSSHGFMNYSAGNVLETHFYLEKGSHDNKQYFPSGTPSVAIANVSNSSNKTDSQTVSKTPRALKSVRSSVNLDFQNENPLSGGKDSGINRRASFLSTVSSQSQEFGEPIALSPLLNNESSHAAQSYLTRSQTFVPMSVSTKQARAERVANSMFNPTMYSKSFDMADVYAPPMAVPRSDNGSASYDFLSNTEENRNSSGNSYTPSTSLNLSSIIANDRIGNGNGAVTPEVAALVMEKISSTGPYGLVKRPSLAGNAIELS